MSHIIFGPINSRRLGISLGVNLVPAKTCTLDCVYCEAGATTLLTLCPKPFYHGEEVISELERFFQKKTKLDYITFSGLGEPTLNSEIGQIINYIKKNWKQYKLCLITNSTLLVDENLFLCDLIMPSLDAVSNDVFQKINRPHCELKPEQMIQNLIEFRKKFRNQMWLEIFIIEGINDTESELILLKSACEKIKPDKIQINSLDRSGVLEWVRKVSPKRLQEIKEFFSPLTAEIV